MRFNSSGADQKTMAKLIIKKGGKVFRKNYNSEYDVTDNAFQFLFEDCYLEDDIILKDIFVILKRHADIYDAVLGNWCLDFVEEAFSDNPKKDEDLSCAELYWSFSESEVKRTHSFFPCFHGIGLDSETQYSLSLTQPSEILDTKLRLNHSVVIGEQEYQIAYSFGQILNGIIWELSFHGSPDDKESTKERFKTTLSRIKSGEEETYDLL